MSKKYFSPEYREYMQSFVWHEKSNKCKNATKRICVLFPWLKANHSHHLTYKNFKKEVIVRDIVPLSKVAHKIVHIELFYNTKIKLMVNYYLRIATILFIILGFLRRK
jgi:hypothetical protein